MPHPQGKRVRLTITGYNLSRREFYAKDTAGHEYSINFQNYEQVYHQAVQQVRDLQQQTQQQQEHMQQLLRIGREQAMEVKSDS